MASTPRIKRPSFESRNNTGSQLSNSEEPWHWVGDLGLLVGEFVVWCRILGSKVLEV